MKKLFINFSNHPSTQWSQEQLDAANKFGEIIDLPFPNIDEKLDTASIHRLAETYVKKINELTGNQPCTVHAMGEMTFTFYVVSRLKTFGYKCVASSTVRDVVFLPNGSKQVAFHFSRFREY